MIALNGTHPGIKTRPSSLPPMSHMPHCYVMVLRQKLLLLLLLLLRSRHARMSDE